MRPSGGPGAASAGGGQPPGNGHRQQEVSAPGETKNTLCRISFLVTSRISWLMLSSLPTVGGTRRKSRTLKETDAC